MWDGWETLGGTEMTDEQQQLYDIVADWWERTMTERNFTKELLYSYYADMENGDDVESIDYRSLIYIITELCDRIEQLEKDNELLKSYAWEQ
jgi:hypothetical protein